MKATRLCFVRASAAECIPAIVEFFTAKGWQVYVEKWSDGPDYHVYGYPPEENK